MAFYERGIKSIVGHLTITAHDKAIVSLEFRQSQKNDSSEILDIAEVQLEQYFLGQRHEFKLPLDPQGTDFQKKCWQQLQKIPYGRTLSYKEEAMRVASANYARAVAGANNKNPIPIIIPCHRVIGSNGSLVGFAAGLKVKAKLLELEGKSS